MNSSNALSITTFIYLTAAIFYTLAWVFHKKPAARLATWILGLAAAGNVLGIVLRWIESYQMGFGHTPLSNLFESLIFFSLTIAVMSLVIQKKYETFIISAFAAPLAFLSMAYASLPNISPAIHTAMTKASMPVANAQIQPLIPALKSNWLIAHVMTCFLGYAGFAVAFGVSIMYLLKQGKSEGGHGLIARLPETDVLDELTHQLVIFGFFFLSIGIITGAVWANSAWGRYWGWDPKETWSLITWFVYATLLHARFMRGWHGKRIAVLSIIGFMAVIFTYFGVNYLPGLHSYGMG